VERIMAPREKKRVSDSALITSHLMMPQDANFQGNVFGGAIMKLVDEIAGSVATIHTKRNCVTASIDQMNFFEPVYLGNLLILKASVNYVGRTSMEIGVRIEARDLITDKVTHTGSSYLTFVALDDKKRPTLIPDLIPETEVDVRRYNEARQRRALRLVAAGKSP
jgi:acyl-CoA hydrolase